MRPPRLISLVLAASLVAPLVTRAQPASAVPVPSAWKPRTVSVAHGGSVHSTSITGASALFDVNGRSFAMWFVAGPKNGKVAVFLNGKKVRVVDQYASRTVRKAVTFRSTRTKNTVMAVALSTRNRNSKGTAVNIDAFGPSAARCAKGCTRSPRILDREASAQAVNSEAPWYPTAVPAKSSAEWVVPIGSYVRGRDVQPIDTAVPVIRAAACDQAKKVRQGVIVLSFGKQVAGGANGFGQTIPTSEIVATASAWAVLAARGVQMGMPLRIASILSLIHI
ncbi:MAG: hypothetical protein RLZZ526_743 [Actinomycetota bacterium]